MQHGGGGGGELDVHERPHNKALDGQQTETF